MRLKLAIVSGLLLGGCTATPPPQAGQSPAASFVQILAINDFHGNLEPPKVAVDVPAPAP